MALQEPEEGLFAEQFQSITANIGRAIMGKADVLDLAVTCLLAEGHLLIEDAPGVGKTSLAKALAITVQAEFGRIQFTPDLLPSDVVGATIWNRTANTLDFQPGPVFSGIVVADEINRASPKTQSALLEAMAERAGHRGWNYPHAPPAVHGDRHPEPAGARGHLSASREPTRPLLDADRGGLPLETS